MSAEVAVIGFQVVRREGDRIKPIGRRYHVREAAHELAAMACASGQEAFVVEVDGLADPEPATFRRRRT